MKALACLLADVRDPFTRTLEIELSSRFHAVRVLSSVDDIPPCSLLVYDLDYAGEVKADVPRIAFGRGRADGAKVLHRPFTMQELRQRIEAAEGSAYLLPSEDFRTVTVGGDTVTLTEREAKILSILYLANGEAVPRARLAEAAFPEATDPEGSLGVYIHYLRKKLERSKKRILFAHRGGGYSLLLD